MMTTDVAKDRLTTGIDLAATDLGCEPRRLIEILKRYGIIETASSLTLCRASDAAMRRANRFPANHPLRTELTSFATTLLEQATKKPKEKSHV